jgi:hypothetical protein
MDNIAEGFERNGNLNLDSFVSIKGALEKQDRNYTRTRLQLYRRC